MISGILLAAGRGGRFGGDKLLATLPDGRAVATAAATAMTAALPRVLAVVRPGRADLVEALIAAGCEVVEAARADEGIGASLAHGVAACPAASGWVVGLADMPWIRPATIRGVAARLAAGGRIVAPVCAGRRGHPVGFAASHGDELAALGGDRGARPVIEAHREDLVVFDTDDTGVLHDVDTPADLAGYTR